MTGGRLSLKPVWPRRATKQLDEAVPPRSARLGIAELPSPPSDRRPVTPHPGPQWRINGCVRHGALGLAGVGLMAIFGFVGSFVAAAAGVLDLPGYLACAGLSLFVEAVVLWIAALGDPRPGRPPSQGRVGESRIPRENVRPLRR